MYCNLHDHVCKYTRGEDNYQIDILGENIKHHYDFGRNVYKMPHKTIYSIRLTNNGSTRCDATVIVDNENVGTWRINEHSIITIRRPSFTDRKFIFISEHSKEMYETHTPFSPSNGTIKVIFKPERYVHWRIPDGCYGCRGNCMTKGMSLGASNGATILGDTSGQQFNTTSPIHNYDYMITKMVYLEIDNDIYEQEYVSLHNRPHHLCHNCGHYID